MRFVSLAMLFFGLLTLSPFSYSQSQDTEQASLPKLSTSVDNNTNNNAYISDELFIFMRSGAGKQYRLLGSITAGTAITLIDSVTNGFQKITDDKGRTGWVEQQFISKKPSLRSVIAELNTQLTNKDETIKALNADLANKQQQITVLNTNNKKFTAQIKSLTKQLTTSQAKIQHQDSSTQKQWFFNGAIVLGIGLFLGLLLPRFFGRRRNAMGSWQ